MQWFLINSLQSRLDFPWHSCPKTAEMCLRIALMLTQCGELTCKYVTLFTYMLSIWHDIYLLQLCYHLVAVVGKGTVLYKRRNNTQSVANVNMVIKEVLYLCSEIENGLLNTLEDYWSISLWHISVAHNLNSGRDSSVGVATCYELGGPGMDSQ